MRSLIGITSIHHHISGCHITVNNPAESILITIEFSRFLITQTDLTTSTL
jgi:hypothetical protein